METLEIRTLEAFLRAISTQTEPLPPSLQAKIRHLGQSLNNNHSQAVRGIPELVQQDAHLKAAYDKHYRVLQKKYKDQERTKGFAIPVTEAASLQNEAQIAQLFYSENLTDSVQQFLTRLDRARSKPTQTSNFWKQGDRILSLATGGAFLGVLLAELPGALIGACLAVAYAWFSRSTSQESRKA